ncbi:MAG: serine acetyltransferase [Kiritimatiellae bacterium]|nr:serine acetyltransferase [Kiritimatiellia bacterium]
MNRCASECTGGEQERALCDTVAELLPLYCTTEEDRPDSVLGGCPNPVQVIEALTILIDGLFPGRMSPGGGIEADELGIYLMRRLSHAWRLLRPEITKALRFRRMGASAGSGVDAPAEAADPLEASRIIQAYLRRMSAVRRLLLEDVRAAYEGDPAALTYAEVQLAYPGVLAMCSHRLAHELYLLDVPIIPRIMSEWTHSQTGVDIHPGARIGHGFFIDHATGVVIGETCHIGNHVKVYQGVTLGARSFPLDENGNPIKHIQRHPTVEDEVVIYANATILGGETVIGRGSTIGGNVFLMESVPPNSFVANEHPELKIKRG